MKKYYALLACTLAIGTCHFMAQGPTNREIFPQERNFFGGTGSYRLAAVASGFGSGVFAKKAWENFKSWRKKRALLQSIKKNKRGTQAHTNAQKALARLNAKHAGRYATAQGVIAGLLALASYYFTGPNKPLLAQAAAVQDPYPHARQYQAPRYPSNDYPAPMPMAGPAYGDAAAVPADFGRDDAADHRYRHRIGLRAEAYRDRPGPGAGVFEDAMEEVEADEEYPGAGAGADLDREPLPPTRTP